jgi:carboxypeptidase Q
MIQKVSFRTALTLACAIFVFGRLSHAQETVERLDKIEKQLGDLKKLVEEVRESVRPPSSGSNTDDTKKPEKVADPITRIREEGLKRSQLMATLSHLTEVIGPRLTGSPNLKRANEWTRDTLASWGLENARVEPWGHFGRGWSLKRFSAQILEPYAFPVVGFPKAWSPGFDQPFVGEIVHLDAKTEVDLEKYKGKLKDAIVLVSSTREIKARFEPLALRLTETNLLSMANAPERRSRNRESRGESARGSRTNFPARVLAFLAEEKAALAVSSSSQGDGGAIFISSASLPATGSQSRQNETNTPRAWSTNAPAILPQITLATEDYNRLVRMLQHGQKIKMEVDLQTEFHDKELDASNTIAEIPGGDLKNEIVMLGAHLDSWHAGTGATDNGAGVAAVMEAVRILKGLNLQPRRTIRVALWTGEEQGLLGSKGYVSNHFGYYSNVTTVTDTPIDNADKQTSTNSTRRTLIRHPDYENLTAYFNLDNGSGKIRGVYMEGNEAVRPIFRSWLEAFSDLGADTLTLSPTSGTDHIPFDSIGLPGFQFIQDPMEYWSRTHHSNIDVLDRIQADDLKQAATILAAFAYNAAMREQKLPRKPLPESTSPAAPAVAVDASANTTIAESTAPRK